MVSEVVPPGWYPDPGQRFEARYWDGTRWTDHVRHPAFGTVLLDREVTAGIRGRHRLVMGDRAFAWDADVVPYEAVTSIVHKTLDVTTAGITTTTYDTHVTHVLGSTRVLFLGRASNREARATYGEVIRIFDAHLVPGLVARLRDRVVAGEALEVGAVTLDRAGIHRRGLGRRKDVSWPEFDAAVAREEGIGISVNRGVPNGLLLPDLLHACAAALR